MNRSDDDSRRLEAALRAIDPGRDAASELSARRRQRVMWSWRHPLLAWCIRHHSALALAGALAVVSALAAWMLFEQRAASENWRIPTSVSAPVRVLSPPVENP